MLNDCIKFENKHGNFENKISEDVYDTLEKMYSLIVEKDKNAFINKVNENLDLLKKISLEKDLHPADIKLKVSIIYLRWCIIIKNLIEEYEDDNANGKKKIIDYYIGSKNMKEMNTFGLVYYYDVKYKKNTETLYSVGYGGDSTWEDWLDKKNLKCNQLQGNVIQLMFEACRDHINPGDKIRLKSLSKCFGVDLFKYMRLDENNVANLYIIKDANVNFIKIGDEEISLQDYLLLEDDIINNKVDLKNNSPQFCLDFSNVRNEKIENFNRWSKRFLGEDKYISQKEFDESKKDNIKENYFFILHMLREEKRKQGEKAISSRVSPIVDKEVIVSDNLWTVDKINSNEVALKEKEKGISPKVCYHFTFDTKEYYQLIFNYFKEYAKEKNGKNEKQFIDSYKSLIGEYESYYEKFLNEKKQDENEMNREQDFNYLENLNDIIENLKYLGDGFLTEEIPDKVNLALLFIDWDKEEIRKKWLIKNIYKLEGINNVFISLYKCICKDSAL